MRRLLILIVISLVVSTSYGQSKEKDINKAGFKFDINSSVILGSDIPDTSEIGAKTGFSAGIFYREALGGIFGGQIEVRYVQMGGIAKQKDFEDTKILLDYIRFGAQFKLYPLTSTLGANAFLGFEYGLLLSANQQVGDEEKVDIGDLYKSGDYGIHAGVGLDFDFGLTTDLRIYLGVADITETSLSGRNFSVQYHLGWGF